MSTKSGVPNTISSYLSEPFTLSKPEVSGPMAVYPVFGAPPEQEYTSVGRAHAQGFTVKELPDGASVRDLLVANPGPVSYTHLTLPTTPYV